MLKPNSFQACYFPAPQLLPAQRLSLYAVSTDTTLRFQEIPQYTPETDTTARWKFNSPLQAGIFQSFKMLRTSFTTPSSKHKWLLPEPPEQKPSVTERKSHGVEAVPPANPLCHQAATADPAQISAWAQAETTDLQLPTQVSDLPSSMATCLSSGGSENSCLSVPVSLSSSDAHPRELFQLSGS